MGTYLAVGIVQNILLDKKRILNKKITTDIIINKLKEEINIDYYQHSEDSDKHYWKINPEILEGNLTEFLEIQFQMYNRSIDQNMQETLHQLRQLKAGPLLIELAASKKLMHFQLINNIVDSIRVFDANGFQSDIVINYQLISFFIDGKILMECYENIFKYLENVVRLHKSQYPIADCIKICITG